MKNFLLIGLAALSFNAFAQSYLILDNGVTITTDKKGFVYDFGHYTSPQNVIFKGGLYLSEEGGILTTVDENGILYKKYEIIPEALIGKGNNYFIGSNAKIYTIDSLGKVAVSENPTLSTATKFGGNFFIAGEELYTVNSQGLIASTVLENLATNEIILVGGNYFLTNRGVLHTVSSEGIVKALPEARVGVILKKGGNYFVDTLGAIYTIANDGTLKMPAIPMNLSVHMMAKLGSSYFIDSSARLFTVDQEGNIWERFASGHDLRTSRIISK